MSRQNFYTVVLCVILSVIASTAANLVIDRRREPISADVVRAKSVELIDAQGRIRGIFELAKDGNGGVLPHLVMRDVDGRDSIEMGVNGRGDGALEFASDHWNEGAVILGHLQNVDDGTESKSKKVEDRSGAWGLRVRSINNRFTSVGFLNSGEPIAPLSNANQHVR